jgi:hypothetical protein
MVSFPPAMMQCTDAGLAISVVGLVADSDGVQATVARAMAQRVAICTDACQLTAMLLFLNSNQFYCVNF